MNTGHSRMTSGRRTQRAGDLPVYPRASYIQPAPLGDVMFEQLEYLLAHRTADCTPECPECFRLTHIQKWLLLPFARPQ